MKIVDFHKKDIAALLGISKRTLNRRSLEIGISMSSKFSNTSDELHSEIQHIVHNFPDISYRTVRSHLCVRRFTVQKMFVLEAMRRIDIENILQRKMSLQSMPKFTRSLYVKKKKEWFLLNVF